MTVPEDAAWAHTMGWITTSELEAIKKGDMGIGINKHEIFNIQHKDTPLPWGTYAPIYEGRADKVLTDQLLGLWP